MPSIFADKIAPKVSQAAHKRGLLARPLPGGDIIALSPPLSITREEVDVVTERLQEALDEVARAG